jgi:YgiT-type zinc finger domain-containing protein
MTEKLPQPLPGNDESTPKEQMRPCSECQAGQMHLRSVTYLTYIGDELISVPDFPAWVCDVCGRCDYDEGALNQLSLILSPNAGRTPVRRRSLQRKSVSHSKNSQVGKAE